jgi:hypothetical protein
MVEFFPPNNITNIPIKININPKIIANGNITILINKIYLKLFILIQI